MTGPGDEAVDLRPVRRWLDRLEAAQARVLTARMLHGTDRRSDAAVVYYEALADFDKAKAELRTALVRAGLT